MKCGILCFCRRSSRWKTAKSIREAKQDYIFCCFRNQGILYYVFAKQGSKSRCELRGFLPNIMIPQPRTSFKRCGAAILCRETYFNRKQQVLFPLPSFFSSPSDTSLRKAPSMELSLRVGHNSRISCLLNRPILFLLALRTISSAGSLVSTSAARSSRSLYAAKIVPRRYLIKGRTFSVPSCQPLWDCASA